MEGLTENRAASFPEIDEISSMLKRESRFFMGREGLEIQNLTNVLEDLNNFLKIADAKSVEELTRESVKSWLEQIKEDTEEVNCYVEENCLLKLSTIFQEQRLINFLRRAGRRFRDLKAFHKASQLEISENGLRKEEEEEATMASTRKLVSSSVEEYVDSAAKGVVAWLTEGEPARSVLSLFGPGGIGKTTIAKKVYESAMVQDHFDFCLWIDASGLYKIDNLRKVMLKQILPAVQNDGGVLDGTRTNDLIRTLRQSLQPKRYMFVFDNVSYLGFWDFIKHGLPDNDKGSRILITTASDTVVDYRKEDSFDRVQKLRPLEDAESWESFCRVAFRDEPESRCPPELEVLSREFVDMCRGYPLLIVAIAGLLSKRGKVVLEWEKVHSSFKLVVKTDPPRVLDVLALGFYELPGHLRPCFLYFSIFPQDFLIPNKKLFKLWIAEGFVKEKKGKTLEEVADEYLTELILRDLVQPCHGFYGLDRFFQVDWTMHSIAREKAAELNFSSVCEGNSSSFRGERLLRLSIYNAPNVSETITDYRTRSVFLFNVRAIYISFLATLSLSSEFMTVLNFEDCPLEHLPDELGNLFHLKYLSLKNTLVSRLPRSIHKLRSLETLNLTNTLLIELPSEINYLQSLRHLSASVNVNEIGGDSTKGVRIKMGIKWLQNLKTLMHVEVSHKGINIMKEIALLPELRRLGISGLSEEDASALSDCIDNLRHLESLTLQANDKEVLNLQRISSRIPLLQRLVLKGFLPKLPDGISHLQNLTVFCLSLSRLMEDPLKQLSRLPNLVSLWLYHAYDGEKLHFEEGCFKRLKLLVIRNLHRLYGLEIEDGALPLLEELRIGSSPRMNKVPIGICHLRNLKVLTNYDMPKEFVLSMQPEEGSAYWKVEHVTSVLFCYQIQGKSYKVFKLGDSELLDHLGGLATNTDVFLHCHLDLESSFCEGYYEEDNGSVGRSKSFSSTPSLVAWKNTKQWSSRSTVFSDDFEY